jgi:hypothetical protein
MSGYTVERLPDEPIILHNILSEWNVSRDITNSIDECVRLLDAAVEPIYFITIMADDVPINFHDLLVASTRIARGSNALMHHRNLKQYLVVTRFAPVKMAVRGLNSEVFGNVPTVAFDTLEEALAYIRAQQPQHEGV